MYSSRGNNNGYGQQQQNYSAQAAYAQNLGADGASQLSMAARHSAILGGSQEADIGYRAQPSAGAHYGGQYSSVYGSAALSSAQQAPPASAKGAGPSALEGRSGYGSTMLESPKFTSGDYVSSTSHGYGQKGDHVFAENLSDYKSLDRRQYAERTGAYIGRDLQSDPAGRFADSISFGHQHQPDLYDRIDQASVLRQEHMLKAQAMQSSSIDGGPRQADYLAVRGANIRRQAPELMSYSGRMEADPHSLSMLAGSSHGAQHAPSILGAAPRRDVDDLAYAHSSSNPGYGVSLPPGRDYATGKGLHGSSLDPDYPGSILARGGYARIDDRKDDRGGYARELERREEERRRELLREREKDREREKERERERDRERERKRERERILERREKEKERDRKRGPEVRRERTPPRISRDRGRSSSTKGGRSLRRESPRVEASHRRHSPVKEKRREYACKVYSSSLVDIERDYLSMDRRYPRLFVSPECSKVVVNWPRENLKIPFYTPVSFEHDFIEEETASELKTASTMVMTGSPAKPERASIQWNAKIIFMSGLSQNALEELSSERSYDDRIPHFCNMLRFAILKKENSFMTIGGPWDSIDGADPSVDNSSLVQTALRYANGVTQLDLKNCQHWNPFLEIHYDRLGKDGLFSHKEITVLYIPDLSECLPSIDAWRDQWLANKKAIAERERLHALKKEKSREKDEVKDREAQSKKDLKKDGKSEKNKDSESAGNIKEKDGTKEKEKAAIKVGDEDNIKVDKIDMVEKVEEDNDSGKKNQLETAGVQAAGSGKKKIVRRVVKKVAAKKNDAGNAAKPNDKLDVGEKNSTAEVTGQEGDSTINSTTVKTFTRKKITKKGVKSSVAKKQDEGGVPEILSAKEPISFNEKPEGNSDPSSEALVLDTPPKTTVKKKIIKRVAKKKVVAKNVNEGVTSAKDDNEDREKVTLEANEEKTIGDADADADANNQGSEAKSKNKTVPKTKSKTASAEKQESVGGSNESKNKGKNGSGKEEKRTNEKSVSGSKMNIDNDKQKVSQTDGLTDKREKSKEQEKSKDGKERKDRDGKAEPKSRDTKEKKRHDEPPRHPGLFLQTKGSKDSRLHSLSLSLDSLLDYTDKDIEESTFELSLFAETLYEMLQYQMGSRLLTFLQKLRIKFMAKRNERKRQREESLAKESEKASASKRVKTEDSNMENKTVKTETLDETRPDDEMAVVKREDTSADKIADVKLEDELDEEEDPDEDPEEDEEMAEPSIKDESENEENVTEEKVDIDAKSEEMAEKKKDEQEENAMETSDTKPKLEGKDGKEAKAKAKAKAKAEETKKKETPVIIDKELLQAFRFFDRNRVGYIRVEDLRLILHNLGKFMSHRDVKEIVQSALLESNTGRDDRILYNKLVRMPET